MTEPSPDTTFSLRNARNERLVSGGLFGELHAAQKLPEKGIFSALGTSTASTLALSPGGEFSPKRVMMKQLEGIRIAQHYMSLYYISQSTLFYDTCFLFLHPFVLPILIP